MRFEVGLISGKYIRKCWLLLSMKHGTYCFTRKMCKFVNLETVVVPLYPIPLVGCHCFSASSAQSATVSVHIFGILFRVVSMFTYFIAVLLVL